MGWTKKKLIEKAFSKIGISSNSQELDPEELQDAAEDLDAMMAEWSALGIKVGWPLSSDPQTVDVKAETNVEDGAVSAIYHNLAIRIAPDYGKTPSPVIMNIAASTFKKLQSRRSAPPKIQPRTTLAGAGNHNQYGHSQSIMLPRETNPTITEPADGVKFLEK